MNVGLTGMRNESGHLNLSSGRQGEQAPGSQNRYGFRLRRWDLARDAFWVGLLAFLLLEFGGCSPITSSSWIIWCNLSGREWCEARTGKSLEAADEMADSLKVGI